jgi:hypothetical protein
MPRYRVTLTRTTVEIVEAPNPYQAAIVANEVGGDAEIVSVAPATGRPAGTTGVRAASTPGKKVAKKRRPLSPEARARLAQNLVKARAARAAKRMSAGQPAKKSPAKKAGKSPVKKAGATKKRA